METAFNEFLEKAGLTEKEALVYNILLAEGGLTVAKLVGKTGLKRGDLYNILYSLGEKGLVEQLAEKKVATFIPCDPMRVKEHLDAQRTHIKQAEALAETLLPQMVSQYNLVQNKPSIRHYEGLTGLRNIYDEMFRSGEKELLLLRSVYDNSTPELHDFVNEIADEQVKRGICLRLIAPLEDKSRRRYTVTDKERNILRRIVEPDMLVLPAEILVWGNCVALMSLRQNLVATLIENPDIADTFRRMFEYMWEKAKPYHDELVEEWGTEK